MSEANPRWLNSALPYFIKMKDYSAYDTSNQLARRSRTSFIGESSQDQQQQHSGAGTGSGSQEKLSTISSSSTSVMGTFSATDTYPEVRYVFADDDFDPTVDILDTEDPKEVSIVLDFDETGEKIVDYKSFSSNWQITNVKLFSGSSPGSFSRSSSVPSWVNQGSSTDDITSIIAIEGTSSTIKDNNVNTIPELISMFESRQDQLRKILNSAVDANHLPS